MAKVKMETGVVVMTLTATVYRGVIREIHSSRKGFVESITRIYFPKWVMSSKRYMRNKLRLNIRKNQSSLIR